MEAAVATYHVGSLSFNVVSDGTLMVPTDMFLKDVPSQVWPSELPGLQRGGYFLGGMNCLLVRSEGKSILVDTGVGTKASTRADMKAKPNPDAGTLLQNLAALGVQPDDVDIVIITHAHFDHIGWCTTERDGLLVPTFGRAVYWLMRGEWELATRPENLARFPAFRDNLGPLKAGGRVALAEGETAITSQVSLLPSHGHSIGHTCVALQSEGQYAVHIGDVIHHPIQVKYADCLSLIDYDGPGTQSARRAVMEWALAHDALVIASHTLFPGSGRLVRQGGVTLWQEAVS